MSKIKEILKPTEEQKYTKYINNFIKKYVPERYNQIKLMRFLFNDDIDHYVSISNRADGKSFNYIHFLLMLAIDYGIGFTFLVRRYTVRIAGQKILQKIIDTFDHFNPRDFMFMRTDFYIVVIYKDRHIGIITDLNQATDLKYQSNYLQDFPMIIYDEFLALEGDYLIDEWDRLKTIYSSIDRNIDIPHLRIPKILYLGNAVNFSSPILANLNLFNLLEKHKMNTVKQYDNIILEFNRNENANEQRNLRAFREKEDAMTQGEFTMNEHNIANDNDRNRINKAPHYIYIKLRDNYLKITYNRNTHESILSIISYHTDYDFNYLLKDNKKTSIFLDSGYYDNNHERKYNKDIYLFDNMFSKDTIVDGNGQLRDIKINKIIRKHSLENELTNFELNEIIYKENHIENTKKSLFKRFLNE